MSAIFFCNYHSTCQESRDLTNNIKHHPSSLELLNWSMESKQSAQIMVETHRFCTMNSQKPKLWTPRNQSSVGLNSRKIRFYTNLRWLARLQASEESWIVRESSITRALFLELVGKICEVRWPTWARCASQIFRSISSEWIPQNPVVGLHFIMLVG